MCGPIRHICSKTLPFCIFISAGSAAAAERHNKGANIPSSGCEIFGVFGI